MRFALLLAVLVPMLLVGCSHIESDMSMEAEGMFVRQPFFEPEGMIYSIGDAQVQVYQYENKAAADAAIRHISREGSVIAGQLVDWQGDPHLYQDDAQIIVYVGRDRQVLRVLEEMYGMPFAER